MLRQLLPMIKSVISSLWDQRVQGALVESKLHVGDPSDAFRKGYSQGYWDGIADMAGVVAQQEELLHSRSLSPVQLTGQPIAEA